MAAAFFLAGGAFAFALAVGLVLQVLQSGGRELEGDVLEPGGQRRCLLPGAKRGDFGPQRVGGKVEGVAQGPA